jgi:hypothetical protein
MYLHGNDVDVFTWNGMCVLPFHINAYAYTWNGSFEMEPEVGKFYELGPFYDNQGPDHDLG